MAGPIERNFTGRDALHRGDTISILIEGVTFSEGRDLFTAGIVIRSTVKRYLDEPDPGLCQVDTQNDGIEALSPTSLRVTYPASDVDAFPLTRVHYDVTADFSNDDSHTLQFGALEIVGDATRGTT